MNSVVDREKYLAGLSYGLVPELIIFTIVAIVWLITGQSFREYPIDLITFGYGGLLLTISGCIGPGRYQKRYDLLIYQPEPGTSFSDEIPVSGFVVDETIEKADIIVNGQKAGELVFGKDHTAETTINRSDFINSVLNKIYLQSGDTRSNTNEFTLFEYTEDMTAEEVEEFHQLETSKPDKTIQEAKQSYIERITRRMGSLTLGILTLSLVNLLFAFVRDYLSTVYA